MAIAKEEKLLAQASLSTDPVAVYSPPTGLRAIVRTIIACNTESPAAPHTLNIYHDDDGGETGSDKAIVFEKSIDGADFLQIDIFMPVAEGEVISAEADSLSVITLTLYGEEIRNA